MNDENEVHAGGCLCGAVRYRAEGPLLYVNHCHCRMCRKAGGAPVVTWVTFPSDNVTFTAAKPAIRRSSAIAVRGFCPECGSALTWQGDKDPDSIDVTVGTLDRPDLVTPRDHIWTESALSWIHMADGLPRYRRSRQEG